MYSCYFGVLHHTHTQTELGCWYPHEPPTTNNFTVVRPALSSFRSRSTRSSVQIVEPDIYDIIEADNTAMEKVAKARKKAAEAAAASGTPTYSGTHSSLGRSLSRGILKRGKGSRRPGSDTVRSRAGFSDVKSVSRYVDIISYTKQSVETNSFSSEPCNNNETKVL